MTNLKQGKLRYIIKAYLVAIFSAFSIASIMFWLFQPDPKESIETHVLVDFFGIVIFAPAVETLLMIPILKGIEFITKSLSVAALISASVWAIGHSLLWPIWGVVVFIPFLVFSYALLHWKKESARSAFIVVATIHALVNFTAFAGGEITKQIEKRKNQTHANKAVEATAANARLFHIEPMRIHHPINPDE